MSKSIQVIRSKRKQEIREKKHVPAQGTCYCRLEVEQMCKFHFLLKKGSPTIDQTKYLANIMT